MDALNTGDWGGKTRVVQVNDWTTHWTYRDVVTVVEGAAQNLECVMLPKVQDAGQVTALDLLLTQIEKAMGFEAGLEVPMLLIGEGTAEIQKMIVGRRLSRSTGPTAQRTRARRRARHETGGSWRSNALDPRFHSV